MKYSDLGHAFYVNMKMMSIHKCKMSGSLVVRWQLTDLVYLDRNLDKPFFNDCQIASVFKSKIVLVFYVISW